MQPPSTLPLSPRMCQVRVTQAVSPASATTLLACVVHGDETVAPPAPAMAVRVATPRLAGPGIEYWESPLPVQRGSEGDIEFAHNGAVLFGQLRIPAAALAPDAAGATEHAFRAIHRFLDASGYPHCWRMWNYIPDIHRGEGDDERYRQFVLGRHRAWAGREDFEHRLPAATAIGTPDGGLLIYWLAGRHSGVPVENPRQVSAYRYPRQYGPRSPSFSRALRVDWRDGADLFVSGTASIVGHETLHHGDPRGQLREVLANLDALREAAGPAGRPWRARALKLFLRDPSLRDALHDELAALAQLAPLTVLQGDICRRDLHLEIEPLYDSEA
jgi:chorismate lyase/3-hydroxybenzoate synthase